MTLPDGYNPFEHLQNISNQVLTRLVRAEFADVGDDDWEPEITTPRGALRLACAPDDTDTGWMTLQRYFLFYFVIRSGEDFAPIPYGLHNSSEDITALKYPQIQVFYKESRYDATGLDRIPVQKQCSFRWREENLTPANLNAIALKIKQDLATPKLFWRCGRQLYTYKDLSKPYNFQVYANSEADAKKVIEASFRLQDDFEPDWDEYLRPHGDNSPPPPNQTRLVDGEVIKLPDPYPIATVEFAWAQLKVPKIRKPYILVDATGTKRGARERV